MKPGGPWSVKGIEPQAREAAKTAARRAGKTLGEWLNQVIMESGQEETVSPTDLLRNPELWQTEEGSAPWSAAIEEIKQRIEVSEKRNVELLRQIDGAIGGLAKQLAEKRGPELLDGAGDDVAARLLSLEEQAQRMLSRDSLKVIEKAVGDVAVVLSASEKRQSERSDRIELNLEDLTNRFGRVEKRVTEFGESLSTDGNGIGDPAFAASLAAEMAALRDRVQESEEHATNAFENVHRNISEVVQRLDGDQDVSKIIAASEGRTSSSIQTLEQSLEELSRQVQEAAAERSDSFESFRFTLNSIDERVQSLEAMPPPAAASAASPVGETVEPSLTFDREEFKDLLETETSDSGSGEEVLSRVEAPSVEASPMTDVTPETLEHSDEDNLMPPPLDDGEEEDSDPTGMAPASEWEILEEEPRRSPVDIVRSLLTSVKEWRHQRWDDDQDNEAEPQLSENNDTADTQDSESDTVSDPASPLVEDELIQPSPSIAVSEANNTAEKSEGSEEIQENEPEVASLSAGFVIDQKKDDTNRVEEEDEEGEDDRSLSEKLKNIRDALISQSPEEEESFRGSLRELVSRDEEESNKRPYYLASGALVLAVATIVSIVLYSDNGVRLEADGNRPSFGENVRGLLFGAPGTVQDKDPGSIDGPSLEEELAGKLDDTDLGTLTELSETVDRASNNTTSLPGSLQSADFDVTAGLLDQAENGDMKAQFALARAFATGQGFTQDQQLALKWYRAAAGQELAVAQYLLGSHYERGLGVARDGAAAVDWYARAAAGGNVRAMHNLAVAYAQGHHVDQDLQLAVHWFQEAAELGLTDAQFNLGLMLERGLGISADKVQAFKWYSVAALDGDVGAIRRVEQISGEITESDHRFVELFVDTWRPRVQDPIANGLFDVSPMAFADQVQRTQIAHVQDMLDRLGYNIAATDGIIDPTTTTAIKEYQNLSLMPASGEVTPELIDRLEDAVP